MTSTMYGSQCFVEIYPYEGGPMLLSSPLVRNIQVQTNIHSVGGTFSMSLRPGGPNGTDASPTWGQCLTRMSLVVVGMSRGTYCHIVMIGVITGVSEQEVWPGNNRPPTRTCLVQGVDFSYFFSTFNFYSLAMLGMTIGAAAGEASTLGTGVALQELVIGTRYAYGQPDQLATRFFNEIMVGPKGLLANTFAPYSQGTRLKLRDIFGVFFEPASGGPVIPDMSSFVTTEGSWYTKFTNLLQWPLYEFFVATAPVGYYGSHSYGADAVKNDPYLAQGSGYAFKLRSLTQAPPSAPQVVGRINPLPTISVKSNGLNVGFDYLSLDMSRWNNLTLNQLDAGYLVSNVGFSIDEVRNFYAINPTAAQGLAGNTGGETNPFMYGSFLAFNPASINRYGYRPEIFSTDYFYDLLNLTASSGSDFATVIAGIFARLTTQYEPTPFMARGEVTFNLRPDIMIGDRFRYRPFKSMDTYDFYIEGVAHTFDFEGEQAITTLNLSRGLPTVVYNDATDTGVLRAVHMGDARFGPNGVLTKGLANGVGYPLKVITPGADITNYLGSLTPGFIEPQAL